MNCAHRISDAQIRVAAGDLNIWPAALPKGKSFWLKDDLPAGCIVSWAPVSTAKHAVRAAKDGNHIFRVDTGAFTRVKTTVAPVAGEQLHFFNPARKYNAWRLIRSGQINDESGACMVSCVMYV